MGYNAAYTSSFWSLDGVAWRVDILIRDHSGDPVEIRLDADRPVVIEWQETKVYDSACPSLCTVKVVSETDRQMIGLMAADALCEVYRNNALYWMGKIDDCVYEEPYSYRRNYVTEISFSDFGCLNRYRFTMSGRSYLGEILVDILGSAELSNLPLSPDFRIQTDSANAFNYYGIKIDTDVFGPGECSKLEALERVLKPFGLRLVQINGTLHMHDLEYMCTSEASDFMSELPVVWQGTDARIQGSECFGRYKVSAKEDHKEVLADLFDGLTLPEGILGAGRYYAKMEEDDDAYRDAFWIHPIPYSNNDKASVLRGGVADVTPGAIDCKDRFVFERIRCFDSNETDPILSRFEKDLGSDTTPQTTHPGEPIIRIETGMIPSVQDRDDYRLRVNLDFLLSPKRVPQIEAGGFNYEGRGETKYKKWKDNLLIVLVPARLEAVDANGDVVARYCNESGRCWYSPSSDHTFWLAYYNDDLDGTPLEEWATNRPYLVPDRDYYSRRADGEYVPLPPIPCRLRLTIKNSVYISHTAEGKSVLSNFNSLIRWQAYKNASVTLVKSGATDDGELWEKEICWGDCLYDTDEFTEEHDFFVVQEGVPPSAKGIITDGEGNAMTSFYANGTDATLLRHRANSLARQLGMTRPMLSGTASLTPGFAVFTEASTAGRFLRIGSVQDLHAGTEMITLLNITPDFPSINAPKYSFSWSSPVCVLRDIPYRYDWSDEVCVQTTVPDHYTFTWSGPVCAYINIAIELEWEEF